MPAGNSAALDELASRLKKATDEMATKRDLAATDDAFARVHNELSGRVAQLDARFGQLTTKVDQDIPGRLDKIESGLKDTNKRLADAENSTVIRNSFVDWRLGNLEERDHQSTYKVGYSPTEAPSLPSPPQPQPASPSWGVVKIENNMATWQYMEVNGVKTGIEPGTNQSIRVPSGWVTTRLVGYEGPKTWWVGGPDYFQRVLITPKPAFDSVVRYP
jgi:hypothetical protein